MENLMLSWSGMHYRIEADSELEDLEIVDKRSLLKSAKSIFSKKENEKRITSTNALILHLDGDKRYTQKSQRYYNKLGLRAIVKNVPENRQPQVIGSLIKRYNPDIVIITRTWRYDKI